MTAMVLVRTDAENDPREIFLSARGCSRPAAGYLVGMNDVFTRRGFAKVAGVGLASLLVPSLVRADETVMLTPRWQLVPGHVRDAAEGADANTPELRVTLFLRAPDGRAVELFANAVRVHAHLRAGGVQQDVELQSEGIAFQRRSRAGFRLGRRVTLEAGAEVAYDTFFAPWPSTPAGLVDIQLRTALRERANPAEGDQATFAALAALTGQLTTTRPG